MNSKITFPKLSSLLADKSGRSKRFSEDFLRELFAIISEQLEAGESVKVKGLGTFRLMRVEPRKSVDVTTGLPMEISGHSKVVFTPAKELAEAINAPFEAFSPIEIGDDVELDKIAEEADVEVRDDSEEILLSAGEQIIREDEPKPEEETMEDEVVQDNQVLDEEQLPESNTPMPDEEQMSESDTQMPDEEQLPESDTQMPDEEQLPESDTSDNQDTINFIESENEDDDITIIEKNTRSNESFEKSSGGHATYNPERPGWVRTIIISAACALIAVVATFLIWSILTRPEFKNENNEDADYMAEYEESYQDTEFSDIQIHGNSADGKETNSEAEEVGITESTEEVPTSPSDALIYDTIGTSRYLTTMAKDHYGSNKFWPYIYEENKSHIGHPDKIRPGTPIVIPKLSKYGVDPKNPNDEVKATKLGAEIYARYGKIL